MIGFYGDDFTGSVDALLQFRRGGLSGELVTDPAGAREVQADVVGIAGTARALPTGMMDDEVRPALEALRDVGCDLVLYKACSTADSSPGIGSLGRAAEIGREVFGPRSVPVLLAQPDFGRWTVFGTHFAREGDQVYRLDRQPTMSHHPTTPMTEADLRRHLAAQTSLDIAGVDFLAYDAGPKGVAQAIELSGDLVVLDAVTDSHLTLAAAATTRRSRPVCAIGSGGFALGLGRVVGGSAPQLPLSAAAPSGPVLVVSGSCSGMSWRQIRTAVEAGWTEVDALGPDAAKEASRAYASGSHVVAYTARGSADQDLPADAVSGRLASIVRTVAASAPIARLVVAGGDTCGRVLRLLGARSLRILAAPWGNLPLVEVRGGDLDGVEVVLKGGQVGTPDAYLRIAEHSTAEESTPNVSRAAEQSRAGESR
ncbi:MAG: four-carbon acid sugar kinase family protein [Actinobacteria bacterium]|nr:four-carbon acid sugar kinase family protein [Actinomycetota bacterium]